MRRGLFVTVIQDPPVFSSRDSIDELIDFAKKADIKILFVQIYRANQAWFPSEIADSRPYETCLKNIKEDPLQLLIKQAHAAGIEVHAWLNILSLSNNKDAKLLKKYGTDILTRNVKPKKSLADYKIDNQYFLEPGDVRVQGELLGIVSEILHTYKNLDGIQFDYIRYPDKNPAYGYTKMNIASFKRTTGLKRINEDSKAWKDWKRSQVTKFLKMLVRKTRDIRPDIQISATGCMPYSRAYYEAYQDWPFWLKAGLVDFVTIMSYSPDPLEFKEWITAAKIKSGNFKKVKIGVGAYKLVHSPAVFENEFRICEKAGTDACVIFHYGNFVDNAVLGAFLNDDKNEI